MPCMGPNLKAAKAQGRKIGEEMRPLISKESNLFLDQVRTIRMNLVAMVLFGMSWNT